MPNLTLFLYIRKPLAAQIVNDYLFIFERDDDDKSLDFSVCFYQRRAIGRVLHSRGGVYFTVAGDSRPRESAAVCPSRRRSHCPQPSHSLPFFQFSVPRHLQGTLLLSSLSFSCFIAKSLHSLSFFMLCVFADFELILVLTGDFPFCPLTAINAKLASLAKKLHFFYPFLLNRLIWIGYLADYILG